MRLSVFTDYSLRVLMYAGSKSDGLVTTKEIGEYYGISYHHLVKVVHKLSQKGFIRVRKGQGGGLQLAIEPHLINVGKVVRAVEPDFELVDCFSCSSGCAINSFCTLKGELHSALKAFLNSLDNVSLADLVKNNQTAWVKTSQKTA